MLDAWIRSSVAFFSSALETEVGPILRAVGGSLLLVGGVSGCANPVPPSGGPQDTTPPSVIQTDPGRDAINVSTDTEALRIEFSEYVERSSLPQALSVTPRFERQPTFDWSGRSVEIVFPEPLRDSTTYIFTIDTNLSDVRGVSLDQPLTIAFSTGPRINRGQIRGRVVGGRRGQPQGRVDVYAYAVPDAASGPPQPLPDAPSYRTQTGEEGTFTFEYLREQPYYVVALRDNNRNRQPDVLESYAVPPRPSVWADSGATAVPVPWLLTRGDTIAPELQRVQSSSRERLRVSFNEPVQFGRRAPEAWAPRDTVSGTSVEARAVFADPDRADAVMVRTEPMQEGEYRLSLERGLVTDTLGWALAPDTTRFEAATREDTTQTRFRGFVPQPHSRDSTGAYPLLPQRNPGVRFNEAPDSTTLQRVLAIEDTTGNSRGFSLDTEEGITYRTRFDPPLESGEFVDVRIDGRILAGQDTTYRRRFRRVTSRALGAIEGRIVLADTTWQDVNPTSDTLALRLPFPFGGRSGADSLLVPPEEPGEREALRHAGQRSHEGQGTLVVEMTPVNTDVPIEPRRLTTTPGSTFVFDELPEGEYRFRAFLDRNGNERWDGGTLQPYVPAEPVAWTRQTVEARPRWTTELAEPLRLLVPSSRGEASSSPDSTGSSPDRRR